MSRQQYTLRRKCSHDSCKEFSLTEYKYRKDYDKARKRARENPWYCSRHNPNGENLSPLRLERTCKRVMTASKSGKYPHLKELFWLQDGRDECSSGFQFGDGWNAYANDFPEGTKIIIEMSAQVILPTS